jgi:hypothetical protein
MKDFDRSASEGAAWRRLASAEKDMAGASNFSLRA